MNNYKSKKTTIIDLELGLGQDTVFIKDRFLYLPEYAVVNSGAYTRERDLLFQEADRARELPAIHRLWPEQVNGEKTPNDEHQSRVKSPACKTSFLVFKNQKYTTVQTDHIAFFYIRNDSVSMMCFNGQEYVLNQSLDQVTGSVSTEQFFRVNRKYLINFKAIKEVEHYFLRKLFVKLLIDTPDKLLINKDKTHSFLSWMGDR